MKRSTPADRAAYVAAADAWTADAPPSAAQQWFTSRYRSVVLDIGTDWATSWAPRNWHPSAWAYRKSTAYLRELNLHTAPETARFFVKLQDGALAAINYRCSRAAGCSQPLLDVSNADARAFWLYGADWPSKGIVDPASNACQAMIDPRVYGALDLLACQTGNHAWAPGGRGNVKGLWLDDVLGDLQNDPSPDADSAVARLQSGVPVVNRDLWSSLPFTKKAWTDGMVALLVDLRSAIGGLRARGVLSADEGKVAINLKWSAFGFSTVELPAAGVAIDPIGVRLIQAADLVELENGWIDGRREDDHGQVVSDGLVAGGLETQWSFARRRLYVAQVHALGRSVLEEKTNAADLFEYRDASCLGDADVQTAARNAAHAATAQYNLAATLLNWAPGDMVGDLCELHGRGWDGYASDLGDPLPSSPAPPADAAGLLERRFARGRVIVAPPGASGTVDLGRTMYAWGGTPGAGGGQGLRPVTSVTLKQRQGVVLLSDTCPERACPAALVGQRWKLQGRLRLKAVRSSVPLTGSLTTTRAGEVVTASIAFDDTTVRLRSHGQLPLTAQLSTRVVTPDARLVGLTPFFQATPSSVRFQLTGARLLRQVAVSIGSACQTSTTAALPWSGELGPSGGTLRSTFDTGAFVGCRLDPLMPSPAASEGNTLELRVTPA